MFSDFLTKVTRKRLLIIFGGVVFIILFIFIATHGFLTIQSNKPLKSFSYGNFTNELRVESTSKNGSSGLLPSGIHSIEYPLIDKGVGLKLASVPYFLGITTINQANTTPKLQVEGRGSMAQIAKSAEGLIGWNSSGKRQFIDPAILTNHNTTLVEPDSFFPNLQNAFQINSHVVGGISKVSGLQYAPQYYDLSTKTIQTYALIDSSNVSSRQESGGFSVYNKDSKKIYLYEPGKSSSSVSLSEYDNTVATFNKTPLYSTNGTTTAFFTGGDISTINEDKDIEEKGSSLTLVVIDSKSKQTQRKHFNNAQIRDVLLSPNGKYVAVKTNQSAAIYSTADFEVLFYIPYTTEQFLWASDSNDFAFTTTENGLFTGSISKKQATTVAPYSLIRPTWISFIEDGIVYFTAYSSTNEGSESPDVYSANLKVPQSRVDRKFLTTLPYQGDGFYIDYINGKYLVELTKYISSTKESVSSDDKQRANDYIKNSLGTNKEVIYAYIIVDLRN